jgi:hypothetical protein
MPIRLKTTTCLLLLTACPGDGKPTNGDIDSRRLSFLSCPG